jgi:hypothetical protein
MRTPTRVVIDDVFFEISLASSSESSRARLERQQVSIVQQRRALLSERKRCGLPFEGLLESARALLFLSLGFIYILEEEEAPPRAFQIYFEERKRKRAHLFKRPEGGLLFIYSGEIYTRTRRRNTESSKDFEKKKSNAPWKKTTRT